MDQQSQGSRASLRRGSGPARSLPAAVALWLGQHSRALGLEGLGGGTCNLPSLCAAGCQPLLWPRPTTSTQGHRDLSAGQGSYRGVGSRQHTGCSGSEHRAAHNRGQCHDSPASQSSWHGGHCQAPGISFSSVLGGNGASVSAAEETSGAQAGGVVSGPALGDTSHSGRSHQGPPPYQQDGWGDPVQDEGAGAAQGPILPPTLPAGLLEQVAMWSWSSRFGTLWRAL